MLEEIHIPEKVTSTPYEDHEYPNIRFDKKENEDITKHLLFYKTDKRKSFSEGHKPSDILFDMLKDELKYKNVIKNFLNQNILHLQI